MAKLTDLFERHIPVILASGSAQPLADRRTRDALTLADAAGLTTIYAPFEHINCRARLVIVGITPGISQANVALATAREALKRGLAPAEALRLANQTASFSGTQTRGNLVQLLDAIELPSLFGLPTSARLFDRTAEWVHFTSALRNPVLWQGENYNGRPDMIRTPSLRMAMEAGLGEEAEALPDAIWLPLGAKPALALDHMAKLGLLRRERILLGLPHPSGANNGPIGLFTGRNTPRNETQQRQAGKLIAIRNCLIRQIAGLRDGVSA